MVLGSAVEMLRSGDATLEEAAANALGNLAWGDYDAIVEAGAVAPLVALLLKKSRSEPGAAINALYVLTQRGHEATVVDHIVEDGALGSLVDHCRDGHMSDRIYFEHVIHLLDFSQSCLAGAGVRWTFTLAAGRETSRPARQCDGTRCPDGNQRPLVLKLTRLRSPTRTASSRAFFQKTATPKFNQHDTHKTATQKPATHE